MQKSGEFALILGPPNVALNFPTQASHRRPISTREVLGAKNSWHTHRCARDARRGQTSRYYSLVSTTSNSYECTVVTTATASHRRPARFAARCRSSTDKAALALLERSPQGHTFAERYSTAHVYSHLCTDVGTGKASGIQTCLGTSVADAAPCGEAPRATEVASISAYSCHSFAHAHPGRGGTTRIHGRGAEW